MPKQVEEQRIAGRPQYFLQHKGKRAVAIAKKKGKRVCDGKNDNDNSNNMQRLHVGTRLDVQQQDIPNQIGMADAPRQHNSSIRPGAGGIAGRPGQFNAPAQASFYGTADQAISSNDTAQMGAEGMGGQPSQINCPGQQGFSTGQRSREPQGMDSRPQNPRLFPVGPQNRKTPRNNVLPGFGPGLAFNNQNNNWSS